jgi:hypothetical protein
MLPAWVKAALSANDRLKVYLTVLQVASSHAAQPKHELPNLMAEMTAAGLSDAWLEEVAANATLVEADLHFPDMPRLINGIDFAIEDFTLSDEIRSALIQRVTDRLRAMSIAIGRPTLDVRIVQSVADAAPRARLAGNVDGQAGGSIKEAIAHECG